MGRGLFEYAEVTPTTEEAQQEPQHPADGMDNYIKRRAVLDQSKQLMQSIDAQMQQGTPPQYVLYSTLRLIGLLTGATEWEERQRAGAPRKIKRKCKECGNFFTFPNTIAHRGSKGRSINIDRHVGKPRIDNACRCQVATHVQQRGCDPKSVVGFVCCRHSHSTSNSVRLAIWGKAVHIASSNIVAVGCQRIRVHHRRRRFESPFFARTIYNCRCYARKCCGIVLVTSNSTSHSKAEIPFADGV